MKKYIEKCVRNPWFCINQLEGQKIDPINSLIVDDLLNKENEKVINLDELAVDMSINVMSWLFLFGDKNQQISIMCPTEEMSRNILERVFRKVLDINTISAIPNIEHKENASIKVTTSEMSLDVELVSNGMINNGNTNTISIIDIPRDEFEAENIGRDLGADIQFVFNKNEIQYYETLINASRQAFDRAIKNAKDKGKFYGRILVG